MELENELRKKKYEYYKLYSEKIIPKLRPFEVERKKLFLSAWILSKISPTTICLCLNSISTLLLVIFIFIFIIDFVSAIIKNENLQYFDLNLLPWLMVLFIELLIKPVILFFFVHPNKKILEFQALLKDYCLNDILKIFGELEWKCNIGVMPNSVYEKIGINNLFVKNFDSFIGTYNNIDFKITEIPVSCLEYDSPCFRGGLLVLCFEIQKQVSSCIKITPREKMTIMSKLIQMFWSCVCYLLVGSCIALIFCGVVFIGFLVFVQFSDYSITGIIFAIVYSVLALSLLYFSYKSTQKTKNSKKQEKVKLESEEFNEKFKVDTTDQVEARYIITPAFMERYVKVSKMLGKGELHFHFEKNEAVFWMRTDRNLFEFCDMLTPLDSTESIDNLFDDLNAIYYLIDAFKFDEKTGL